MPRLSQRDKIVRAAVTLFADRGFAEVSTREIAHAAGVKSPAIFYHFENKRALEKAVLGYVASGIIASRERILSSDIDDRAKMKAFVHNFVHTSRDYVEHRKLALRATLHHNSELLNSLADEIYADQNIATLKLIRKLAPKGSDARFILYLMLTLAFGMESLQPMFNSMKPLAKSKRDPRFLTKLILEIAFPNVDWKKVPWCPELF